MSLKLLKNSLLLLSILIGFSSYSQVEESYKLSEKLEEISGLEQLNDTLFAAINDGGNKAKIYILNLEGEIVHSTTVEDEKNRDWEDLASDGKYLFIADLGNNNNDRKNLKIIKVEIDDLLEFKKNIKSKAIKVSYTEQNKYPPKKDSLFFDAEGIAYHDDSLWIFTKPKNKPWTGNAFVYKVPTKKGDYSLKKSDEIIIGDGGWWSDAITAADYYNGKFYLSTYNRLLVYELILGEFVFVREEKYDKLTQKESLLVLDKESIFVADERHKLLKGGKLYKLKNND